MRRNVYALLLAATLAMPAFAQDSRNTGIQKAITDQIDALRAEDFARAFSFASPTIKALFLTPENFGAMVQNGYPMVADPSAVKMLGLRDVARGGFGSGSWSPIGRAAHSCWIIRWLKPRMAGR